MVTADGELIHADESTNSDPQHARIRPGFFGVVVRFYLDLHPLPTVAKSSDYMFTPDVIDELLTSFGMLETVPNSWKAGMNGGIIDGKQYYDEQAGAYKGYFEKEVDTALDILEECPVVKKAVTRRVEVCSMPVGNAKRNNPTGTRYVFDGAWTTRKPPRDSPRGARSLFIELPNCTMVHAVDPRYRSETQGHGLLGARRRVPFALRGRWTRE